MEEMVDERVLKMKKMTVEGIDCHMRNPNKRLWTTVPGGEDEAIGFQRVLCGFLEVQTNGFCVVALKSFMESFMVAFEAFGPAERRQL